MNKTYLVPVAYWISESGSSGAWPEIIKVQAESPHEALMKTRKLLIEKERDEDQVSDCSVWYMGDMGDQVTDTTYGEPDEEGYIMGKPVDLTELNKAMEEREKELRRKIAREVYYTVKCGLENCASLGVSILGPRPNSEYSYVEDVLKAIITKIEGE